MPFDSSSDQGAGGRTGLRPSSPLGVITGRPWRPVPSPPAEVTGRLRRELPVDFPLSDRLLNILASRGLADSRDLERFFYPSLDQLSDPYELLEMDRAVARVLAAARAEERVALHGDFDVDGITGCALLTEFLSELAVDGRRVRLEPAFIPDRAGDGYGVAGRMIRRWGSSGVNLLVTVDTGSAAHDEVALARELGLDVVVLDHHIFSRRPEVAALVNPCRPEGEQGAADSCGVAVAFKLVQAVRAAEPRSLPAGFENSVLDLVALGLVADQMPLVGENRLLARRGLARFQEREEIRPGLAALLAVAGLDRGFPLTASDLAYQVAPRLNACGRIGRVMTALQLLLTRDPEEARVLAEEADRTNQLRKKADLALKEEAVQMAAPFLSRRDCGLVLSSPDWHKGVIGIGAARLVEQFQLPTVLIAVEGEEARGSARSVPDVDVKEALDRCAHLLIRYGGHAQAAGMTLRTADIPEFHRAFLSTLAAMPSQGPVPESYDLELPLAEMSAGQVADLVRELEQMEPFGTGNPRPVFLCSGLCLARPPQPLGNGAHLRFLFRGPDASGSPVGPALGRPFISFGSGEAWRRMLAADPNGGRDLTGCRWDILFQLGRNTYRSRAGAYDPVQQLLVDLRPAAPAP